VPFVINIAAAPQITEQGYRFVFRNFPVASELVTNGLTLTQDLFRATGAAPRIAVFMHVNDTFGQANARAITAILPQLNLPFKSSTPSRTIRRQKTFRSRLPRRKQPRLTFYFLSHV